MIILDLDNCACDDAHRLHILRCSPGLHKPAMIWDAYHAACVADVPANVHLWKDRSDIIVMTGRPWKFYAQTQWWFNQHGLKFYTIFMRPNNDNITSAVDLKRAWVKECFDSGVHVDQAYDDREDIITAYKALGINATRVTAHNKEWV